jgi:hypothetical protein
MKLERSERSRFGKVCEARVGRIGDRPRFLPDRDHCLERSPRRIHPCDEEHETRDEECGREEEYSPHMRVFWK